jgi:hypothetical protein
MSLAIDYDVHGISVDLGKGNRKIVKAANAISEVLASLINRAGKWVDYDKQEDWICCLPNMVDIFSH